MNLSYYYWYFPSVLTPRFCDELIQYGSSKEDQLALTGKFKHGNLNEQNIKDLKQKRDSNVAWLTDSWIYKEIMPYVENANKLAGWNFQLSSSEACQFTKYKLNQYYDWHCDSWERPYNEPNDPKVHNKIRKLSVTCSLSDYKDYQGGELEFDLRNLDPDKPRNVLKCTEILPRGSIVVFPSFVWHRVKAVTKGTRYSLVIWNLGDQYR